MNIVRIFFIIFASYNIVCYLFTEGKIHNSKRQKKYIK
ncbi:hypothetical protein LEP1GSC043_0729 [Leptospira weilii str. Ecochallenge]|uniref:Uncharacterized protein n=1 Tax=Leptospira weilii str. Ecochallenge TaxID=1049986 RepID=N1UBX0_9LEPT|nr:hypothetical protein LEP1GSC043_0729 [Leptospira weilii str. Ecochallenge]